METATTQETLKPDVIKNEFLEKGVTLNEILELMNDLDNDLLDLDLKQMEDLGKAAKIKVDQYKYFFEKVDLEVSRLKSRAKEYKLKYESLEKKKKNLENILMFHVKHNGLKGMTGEEYSFKHVVSKQNKVNINPVYDKPDSKTYFLYPTYIRRKYEWDKAAIKRGIKKEGDTSLLKFCELADSESIRWDLNSSIEDKKQK